MSVGPSEYLANLLLDEFLNSTPVYIKLHLGDPGAVGTANPAVETTRELASFAVASGGVCVSDADVTWTSVAASEDYTYASFWDAASGGQFLQSTILEATAAVAFADYTIPAGAIEFAFLNIAA